MVSNFIQKIILKEVKSNKHYLNYNGPNSALELVYNKKNVSG